ncbi:hypothetical protein [Prevotella sp. S7-1-8]|uniref:hypothetical protein n=1 Tax=Prevotella sp. S7-1-8 TaxID=1284775 RepID=UPI001E4756A1|nr:hypothetical protein [Prevotella sp. S7-1-8]
MKKISWVSQTSCNLSLNSCGKINAASKWIVACATNAIRADEELDKLRSPYVGGWGLESVVTVRVRALAYLGRAVGCGGAMERHFRASRVPACPPRLENVLPDEW